MVFRPNVGDELPLIGVTYRIAEHPAAPGIPYGQEGRAGIVYCLDLTSSPHSAAQPPGVGVRAALKVFKPRFRTPALVALSARLNEYAQLPGLRVCERTVLTPENHPDLLRREPDLTYAVLMPWIEGPTWFDILQEKRPLTPAQSLALASSLTKILTTLEQQGLAHCDLSAPNVLLPALARQTADRGPQTLHRPPSLVELVDVEQMYGLGLPRPPALSSGTAGYAPAHPGDALWSANGDRFAGAVLLAEMLGWCDENVRRVVWGESYFDPAEIQQDCERYRILSQALEMRWGKSVADLFERAWRSETLADCPTFGEWQLVLPQDAQAESAFVAPPLVETPAKEQAVPVEAPQVLPWAPRKGEGFEAAFRNAIEAYRRREWELARELLIPLVEEAPNYSLQGYTPRALLAEVERQSRRRPVPGWVWGLVGGMLAFCVLGVGMVVVVLSRMLSSSPMIPSTWPTYTPYLTDTPYVIPSNTPLPTVTLTPPSASSWQHGKLVFLIRATGTSRLLYWLDLASAREPKLLFNSDTSSSYFFGPWLSRDGNILIYGNLYSGKGYALTLNPVGLPRLVGECQSPSISPSGDRVICNVEGKNYFPVYDIHTGEIVDKINHGISGAVLPAWSPDGSEIAFSVLESTNPWATSVWKVSVSGGAPILLAGDASEDYAPSWSPDGEWIAYQSNLTSQQSEIWVMRRDGSERRQITWSGGGEMWSRGPCFSPDGQWLAFVSNQNGSSGADFGEVFVVSLVTGEVHQITHTGGRVYDWRVTWGP
jgi:Tol biopolymer transport system component